VDVIVVCFYVLRIKKEGIAISNDGILDMKEQKLFPWNSIRSVKMSYAGILKTRKSSILILTDAPSPMKLSIDAHDSLYFLVLLNRLSQNDIEKQVSEVADGLLSLRPVVLAI